MKKSIYATLLGLALAGLLIFQYPVQAQNISGGTLAGTTLSLAQTLTGDTYSVRRQALSQLTLSPASLTLTMSPATDSLAAIRGNITLTSGDTLAAGFLFGVQGKLILDGDTIAVGSGHVAGLYAQISAAKATITSGHVAGLIVSGQTLPNTSNIDMIYAESGGDGVNINSILKTVVNSNYVFDLSRESGGVFALPTSGTGAGQCKQAGLTAAKALAVKVDGTNYWIPLCTAL